MPCFGRMTTEQLEKFVRNGLGILQQVAAGDGIVSVDLDVRFGKDAAKRGHGAFVYSDEGGYHYVSLGDRGAIGRHTITEDAFELAYWVFSGLATLMSAEYAGREPRRSFRRTMLEKKLEILQSVGENYRRRGEIDLDELLKICPYEDDK